LRALQETPCYRDGKIYVQSLSSMIPVLVLGPQPGETILDLTAAPGSKTTQISMMMHDEGKIVANDNHKTRFFRLKANVDQQRATNVELSLHYGEGFGRKFPERFDRVLLDAPCSAEGRFLATEPKSFGYWKPRKVNEMARKQRKLLFSAIHALKPGGVLVYSTCTFAPEENEALIHWAVEKFKGSLEVSDIRLPLPNRMLGLTAWEGKAFHPTTAKTLRILPDSVMEGFFVAKLTKTHTVPC
jgi:tRNA (cytosine49-C5)-methyltransferase